MAVVVIRRVMSLGLLLLACSALQAQAGVKGYSTLMHLGPVDAGINQTITGWGAPDGPGVYVELWRVSAQSGRHESVASVAVDVGGLFSFPGVDVQYGEHFYVTMSRSWHFNTDGDVEGWDSGSSDVLLEVSGGTLKATVWDLNGDGYRDAHFHNFFEHDPQYYRVIEIRLKNPGALVPGSATNLGVFWGQPWNQSVSLHTADIPSEMTGFETVLIPLNVDETNIVPPPRVSGVDGLWFTGNLNNTIRLDPFNDIPRFDASLDGTVFEIDMIRIREDFRLDFHHDDDVMGLGVTTDTGGLLVQDGFFSYQSLGAPSMLFDLLSGKLESQYFTQFIVGVDVSLVAGSGSVGVLFNDDDSGATYTDDGGTLQLAEVPLASQGRSDVGTAMDLHTQPAGEWTEDGRAPVQGLQFNVPQNSTAGDMVQIDYIGFTSANPYGPSDPFFVAPPNSPPVAVVHTDPDPAVVTLQNPDAMVVLDGSSSDDGDGGTQGLLFFWEKVSGPAGSSPSQATDAVVTLTFVLSGDYVYRLTVDDSMDFNSTDSTEVLVTVKDPNPTFLRGDADSNGVAMELVDAQTITGYLFGLENGQPVELLCLDAADVDDSGQVDMSDALFVARYHMGGETPPSAFPDCGSDPTSDGLTGCSYPEDVCARAGFDVPLSQDPQEPGRTEDLLEDLVEALEETAEAMEEAAEETAEAMEEAAEETAEAMEETAEAMEEAAEETAEAMEE